MCAKHHTRQSSHVARARLPVVDPAHGHVAASAVAQFPLAALPALFAEGAVHELVVVRLPPPSRLCLLHTARCPVPEWCTASTPWACRPPLPAPVARFLYCAKVSPGRSPGCPLPCCCCTLSFLTEGPASDGSAVEDLCSGGALVHQQLQGRQGLQLSVMHCCHVCRCCRCWCVRRSIYSCSGCRSSDVGWPDGGCCGCLQGLGAHVCIHQPEPLATCSAYCLRYVELLR